MDENEIEQAASSPVVETLSAALKRDHKENDTPPTAEPPFSPPESAVMNKVTEQPQDIPRPAEKGNEESMEVVPAAAAKWRRDDVDAMSPEQRQRLLQSQRDAGEVKKQRVTSRQRSSSLPRDNSKS
ncbi:hypothetical protein V5799_002239 [Amblyomma americanum]|uniref:Uncharacterized protein n=1 Tax=Amblyomma americanum TaxID=6943 RepID=A0AAQ4CXW9_AMBAM